MRLITDEGTSTLNGRTPTSRWYRGTVTIADSNRKASRRVMRRVYCIVFQSLRDYSLKDRDAPLNLPRSAYSMLNEIREVPWATITTITTITTIITTITTVVTFFDTALEACSLE